MHILQWLNYVSFNIIYRENRNFKGKISGHNIKNTTFCHMCVLMDAGTPETGTGHLGYCVFT